MSLSGITTSKALRVGVRSSMKCTTGAVRAIPRPVNQENRSLRVHATGNVPLKPGSKSFGSDPQTRTKRDISMSGLFGGLKNFVTGGAAKVYINFDNPEQGLETPSVSTPFTVRVQADASSEIKFSKVYVKVQCWEELNNYYVSPRDSDYRGWVDDQTQTQSVEIDIAGAGQLQEGQSANWEASVQLPGGSQPTFIGKQIANKWTIEAGLATGMGGGVNPSTGRQDLNVGA